MYQKTHAHKNVPNLQTQASPQVFGHLVDPCKKQVENEVNLLVNAQKPRVPKSERAYAQVWPLAVLVSEVSVTSRTPVRNKQTPKLTCLLTPEHLGRARTMHEPDTVTWVTINTIKH